MSLTQNASGSTLRSMTDLPPPAGFPAGSGGGRNWEIRTWRSTLLLFLLAAGTGVFLRFGLLNGFPGGLLFPDVRHAHSHLMFFGWATPVLMVLLLKLTGRDGGKPVRFLLGAVLLTALSTFVPFLLSGYRFTVIGGRALPLSMIASGLCGMTWYAFLVLWLVRSRRAERRPTDAFFSAALILLLLSSVAAAALAPAGVFRWGPAVINSLAMFFLELFAEGWFGLALIGIAYRLHPEVRFGSPAKTGLWLLSSGLVMRCLADALLTNGIAGTTFFVHAGNLLAGSGMLLILAPLAALLRRRQFGLWHVVWGLLALKGVFDLLFTVPALSALSDAAGLRVFYLHAFLLGAISIGLIAAARHVWGERAFSQPWLFTAAVLVMTASLLPISGAWPRAWTGRWTLVAAAWTSTLPVLAAAAGLLLPARSRHHHTGKGHAGKQTTG